MTRPEEVRNEMLMALADNELSVAEATALRRVIASDSELARRFAVFEQSRTLLQEAFPAEPVPDEMVAAVRRAASDAASDQGERGKVIALPRRHAPAAPAWGLALAASLVLAVGAFWAGRSGVPVGPVPGEGSGAALAALTLSESLTGEAASLPDGRTARALASFETDLGLCRLIGIDEGRLIACRATREEDWTIALSIAAGEGGGFVPASDSVAAVIDQMLDAINAGPNLGPEDEAGALGL